MEIDIQNIMRMLVARATAKVFIGHPACRDIEWLCLSVDFSVNLFTTAFTLRMFPLWMHPVICYLLPSRYKVKKSIDTAARIIKPLMEKHRETPTKKQESVAEGDDVLLNWMMDNGNEKENELYEMATRQCILTLASIHTTSLAVTNMLFDLCAHPEWFDPLIREIFDVLAETEGKGSTGERLRRLEKMDSFYVESQRFNPPILCKFLREDVGDIPGR